MPSFCCSPSRLFWQLDVLLSLQAPFWFLSCHWWNSALVSMSFLTCPMAVAPGLNSKPEHNLNPSLTPSLSITLTCVTVSKACHCPLAGWALHILWLLRQIPDHSRWDKGSCKVMGGFMIAAISNLCICTCRNAYGLLVTLEGLFSHSVLPASILAQSSAEVTFLDVKPLACVEALWCPPPPHVIPVGRISDSHRSNSFTPPSKHILLAALVAVISYHTLFVECFNPSQNVVTWTSSSTRPIWLNLALFCCV